MGLMKKIGVEKKLMMTHCCNLKSRKKQSLKIYSRHCYIICDTVFTFPYFPFQTSSDDSYSPKVVVTGSIHPAVPASPPTDQRQSPAQQQDPVFQSAEECNADASAQDDGQHQDSGLMLDAACIKVCGCQKYL